MTTATKIQLTFEKERETKGTWRYAEVQDDESARPIVGNVYVTKPALASIGDPASLTVTIEATP